MNVDFAYQSEDEIQSRIRLYDFSTGKQTFFQWQAGMLPSVRGKKVLELGCGTGEFWLPLLSRWSDCELLLTDISADMLNRAQQTLSPLAAMTAGLHFAQVDLNQLPYPAESFDIVIANHNLFYADDVAAVLNAIQQCLKPGGMLICSTIGADHLQQLSDLLRTMNAEFEWAAHRWARVFGLEQGSAMLRDYFAQVDQFEYDNSLHVTSVEPLLTYLKKTMKGSLADWVCQHQDEITAQLMPQLASRGYVRLTPHSGFFLAHKSS